MDVIWLRPWTLHNTTLYIYCPVWRETRRFVPPRKFMSPEGKARGRHEFSGWDKSSCLPTNWAINCLLYRKLQHDVKQHRALCRETRQGNTMSGGKHDDLFSLHVTSLDQSYFFIRHINYMRYNKNCWWKCVSRLIDMLHVFSVVIENLQSAADAERIYGFWSLFFRMGKALYKRWLSETSGTAHKLQFQLIL